jgi:L-asparaginase II
MAGSHAGEDIHEAALESLLKKTGLNEEDLIMNPTLPANANRYKYFVENKILPRKLLHNCAGKHIALMLLARELGGDIKTYWKLENPAQQEVLKYISYVSEYPIDKIGTGVDGCGVPVFAVPLRNIALSFMKLAYPDKIRDENISRAAARMANLIAENPYMMRGHGYICGELNVDSNIVAKGGAMGIYGFGMKKEKLGVAFKIEDGSEDTWPLIVSNILKQLGYENKKTFEMLDKLCPRYILNDNKKEVGEKRAVFIL